ncbi:SixA phosphatase family protein [Roseovarius aestuariivivens]|uniref:SixA phosphatase family protein n=1 Tax=Roseovarius aestuariivivens TaxID=1888910 RepID=UPI0010809A47|nr:histidine phosphatase family protein [Roseovarius aestuariivivens]
MKTLILMRHGKSSWGDPALDDHDRPLNDRGVASVEALGNWLRERGHLPDRALVSTARRTHETFRGLGLDCAEDAQRALYLAEPDTMLETLRKAEGDTVLMIGHNPGIGWLAQDLVTAAPDHPRFEDYPTGATLVVRFDVGNWSEVRPGRGEAVDFIVPRDLTD